MQSPVIRIGVLTPSSNTVLEPITTQMLFGAPGVSVHFSRFRVTEIALTDGALAQFDNETILQAADLLADAKVNVIIWSGTSSGWLGFERDEVLCADIERRTGIRAGTSMLALRELIRGRGIRRVGLITPYLDDVQQRIVATFAAEGIEVVAERHMGLRDNFSFSQISPGDMTTSARQVARAGCEAILVVCTNMAAAPIVPALERELGIPVFDTVATGVWQALRMTGQSLAPLAEWGDLFQRDLQPA